MSLTLPAVRGSEFAALSRQIKAAHLLDRRRVSYTLRIGLTMIVYAGLWTGFAFVGNTWLQTITAVLLGLAYTQIAFLGHDGGHQQVWRSRRANDLLGVVAGNALTGLSYGWWVDKHNKHHGKPNHEGHDPDIGEGVLAFTTTQAARRMGPVARFVTKHQALLFFPLLTLEGLNLHVASVQSLRARATSRYRRTEIVLFSAHLVGYVTGVLLVLDPLHALVFVAVHQAVFGLYMGCSFAPNHKGMPIIEPGRRLDFLRSQVLTSRNVRGGWLTDFVLGGLNYQVEHHLFPSMPRPSLRKAQALVRAHCALHAIDYTESSLFQSYAAALRHLHDLGEPLRRAQATARLATV